VLSQCVRVPAFAGVSKKTLVRRRFDIVCRYSGHTRNQQHSGSSFHLPLQVYFRTAFEPMSGSAVVITKQILKPGSVILKFSSVEAEKKYYNIVLFVFLLHEQECRNSAIIGISLFAYGK
jgi:hypothetical protein